MAFEKQEFVHLTLKQFQIANFLLRYLILLEEPNPAKTQMQVKNGVI